MPNKNDGQSLLAHFADSHAELQKELEIEDVEKRTALVDEIAEALSPLLEKATPQTLYYIVQVALIHYISSTFPLNAWQKETVRSHLHAMVDFFFYVDERSTEEIARDTGASPVGGIDDFLDMLRNDDEDE